MTLSERRLEQLRRRVNVTVLRRIIDAASPSPPSPAAVFQLQLLTTSQSSLSGFFRQSRLNLQDKFSCPRFGPLAYSLQSVQQTWQTCSPIEVLVSTAAATTAASSVYSTSSDDLE